MADITADNMLTHAHELTHGPRRQAYGHPLDDYTRTAGMVSSMLGHKLKEPITPAEMTMIMVCVKLSRQINHPQVDNMVDAAGYAWCTQEIVEETERRNIKSPNPTIPPSYTYTGPRKDINNLPRTGWHFCRIDYNPNRSIYSHPASDLDYCLENAYMSKDPQS